VVRAGRRGRGAHRRGGVELSPFFFDDVADHAKVWPSRFLRQCPKCLGRFLLRENEHCPRWPPEEE
jgi:hypothetical protein